MSSAQQQLDRNTEQINVGNSRDEEGQSSQQIEVEEEIKIDDENERSNNGTEFVNDEDLGSELSGMSVEIPNEVDDVIRSANYLTNYDRDYKSGVLQKIKRKG